jgi:hypothetical protein
MGTHFDGFMQNMQAQTGDRVQSKVEDFMMGCLHAVFPASKIAGCRGIIPLLGEFEGATPPQGLGF